VRRRAQPRARATRRPNRLWRNNAALRRTLSLLSRAPRPERPAPRQLYMLGVVFVFAAAWCIELAIYHFSMKGARAASRGAPPSYNAQAQRGAERSCVQRAARRRPLAPNTPRRPATRALARHARATALAPADTHAHARTRARARAPPRPKTHARHAGTMLQTAERALVPRLLFAHLVCSGVDVAFSVLGVVLGFQSDLFGRVSCMAGDRARNAVLVVIVGNWVILLCSFLVVQSVFNMFSGVEVEESWRRRLAVLGGVLRLAGVAGLVSSDTDPMSDAARAFARVFRHIDFVPSDFATSLVLVGISHADEARRREEAEWAALQAGGGLPPAGPSAATGGIGGMHVGGPGKGEDAEAYARRIVSMGAPASASSVASFGEEGSDAGDGGSDAGASGSERSSAFGAPSPTPRGMFAAGCAASASASGAASAPLLRPGLLAARQLARGRDPELDAVVSEATHFSAFALAPYGWPLYVWAHPRCGACDLCCGAGVRHGGRRRRACWRRCAPWGPNGPQDALDVAALVRFADLDEDDIIHMSFHNSVLGALPYFIARDTRTRSVVLSVRGTLSVADCITDLLYEPAGLDGTVLGSAAGIPPGSCAHNGVLGCARALHADLLRHRVLHEALESASWNLVITGHSLGAGVAALLGLMLRAEYPSLRVWAFSPPGGLLSEALAEAAGEWCTSVVLGNDFICRLSMPNLERLRDEMMSCACRAKQPKFTILRRAAVAGPQLRAGDVMYAPSHYGGGGGSGGGGGGLGGLSGGGEVAEALQRYSASVAGARPAAQAVQLYPPGRLLHLVRLGRLRAANGGGSVYLPRWTTRAQLMSRIVVARNMFTNHFPDKMARELARLSEAIGTPSVEEVSARRAAAATAAALAGGKAGGGGGGAGGMHRGR
jgi:sn1-specific diacylglycerol lipase